MQATLLSEQPLRLATPLHAMGGICQPWRVTGANPSRQSHGREEEFWLPQ